MNRQEGNGPAISQLAGFEDRAPQCTLPSSSNPA
jgi:hypothetical protein